MKCVRTWLPFSATLRFYAAWRALLLFSMLAVHALVHADTQEELRELRQENRALRERLDKQQQVIDALTSKMTNIEQTQKSRDEASGENRGPASTLTQKLSGQTAVNMSGQIAAGYFKTASEGQYPKGEFRVDEARLFLDARAWEDVYGYIEINPMTREAYDDGVRLGEAYLDIERVLKSWGLDSLVNIRLGRFYIPFGEEYLVRYAIDNPLISHSLMDFWGVDEGIELYGSHGPVSYGVAVQNGGHPAVGDFTSDKSIAGKIAYQPKKWLRVSGSGMRTGDLSVDGDGVSEMWFGNGFFRALGNPNTTTRFHADLGEADVEFLLPRGHLKFAGGAIHYDDNDRAADNCRKVYFGYAEGLFRITKQFYGAARYSHIVAQNGFPIVAHGNWPDYFDTHLTDNSWRVSLGFGYTPNPNLVFKMEYTIERGGTVGGRDRNHEDFFGAQAALRF